MDAKKIICDTDVMVDYWKEANPRHLQTRTILRNSIGLENIAVSAITEMELLKGAVNKADLSRIIKSLEPVTTIFINDDVTLKAISLIQTYSLSHNLELPDALIAATGIMTDFELFTYNTKDYKFIAGLSLFKP